MASMWRLPSAIPRPESRRGWRWVAALGGCVWMVLAWTAGSAHAQAAGGGDDSDPATSAVQFYQRYLSSLRHVHCRFSPSCSEYAVQAIATYGLVEGSARAADRLMRCNASAARFHPRDPDGRLADPVTPSDAAVAGLRVPGRLMLAPEPP